MTNVFQNTRMTIVDNGTHYHISFDRWDSLQNDRARWSWEIYSETAGRIAAGDDLTTVPQAGVPNYAEALGTLLSFASACAESQDSATRGENANLFDCEFSEYGLGADDLSVLAECVEGGE